MRARYAAGHATNASQIRYAASSAEPGHQRHGPTRGSIQSAQVARTNSKISTAAKEAGSVPPKAMAALTTAPTSTAVRMRRAAGGAVSVGFCGESRCDEPEKCRDANSLTGCDRVAASAGGAVSPLRSPCVLCMARAPRAALDGSGQEMLETRQDALAGKMFFGECTAAARESRSLTGIFAQSQYGFSE